MGHRTIAQNRKKPAGASVLGRDSTASNSSIAFLHACLLLLKGPLGAYASSILV